MVPELDHDEVCLQASHELPSPTSSNTMSATALHTIETLKAENDRLKETVKEYAKKITRVATLETEMAKIHSAYNSLLKHSEKREGLEKSARAKLQAVIIQLSDANKEVTERHEAVMSQLMSGEAKNQNIPGLDGILRGEIMRKDALVRQLMDQNKMLLNTKERQEVEMAALNETLEVEPNLVLVVDMLDYLDILFFRNNVHTSRSWTPPCPALKPMSSGWRRRTDSKKATLNG